MKKKSLYKLFFLFFLFFVNLIARDITTKTTTVKRSSQRLLVLPVDSLDLILTTNTDATPQERISDSSITSSLNDLIDYEASNCFTVVKFSSSSTKIALSDDTLVLIKENYNKLAKLHNAKFILLPKHCMIEQRIIQPKGWRDSPAYQQPVTYTVVITIIFHLFDSNGELITEIIGTDCAKMPPFYSLFKKRTQKNMAAKDAKKIFSPPVFRALYKTVRDAFRDGITKSIKPI